MLRDEALVRRLHRRLRETPALGDLSGVEVYVAAGTVRLVGTVADAATRDALTTALRTVRGVTRVDADELDLQ